MTDREQPFAPPPPHSNTHADTKRVEIVWLNHNKVYTQLKAQCAHLVKMCVWHDGCVQKVPEYLRTQNATHAEMDVATQTQKWQLTQFLVKSVTLNIWNREM